MRFIDKVRVQVRAGDGGDGAVAWRREKYVPRGGPAGGDGGNGGSIVFEADRGMSTLLELRYRQHLRAEHGIRGASRDKDGRGGEDLVVRVPVGTMVFYEGDARDAGARPPWLAEGDDLEDEMESIYVVDEEPGDDDEPDFIDPFADQLGTEREHRSRSFTPGQRLGDLTSHGQRLVVAQGGRGGRGNIHFKSSTHRAPDISEDGRVGEAHWLRIELKLLADVGVVGFPNVGKSTLIGRISRARPKVADYPFTTLVPQLGVVAVDRDRSFVIADIPGLIEGASEGKGLGHDFLRHLERTRVLLHVLAPDPDPERDPERDLDVLERELEQYGSMFEGRPRVVCINKTDLQRDAAGRERLLGLRDALRGRGIPLFPVCAATGEGVRPLLEALWRRVRDATDREATT